MLRRLVSGQRGGAMGGVLGANLVQTAYLVGHRLTAVDKGRAGSGTRARSKAGPPEAEHLARIDTYWPFVSSEYRAPAIRVRYGRVRGLQIQGRCDVTTCRFVGSERCLLRWVQNWVQLLQRNPELVELVDSCERLPAAIREAMITLRETASVTR